MMETLLYAVDIWVLWPVVVVVLLAATELGYLIGQRLLEPTEPQRTQITTIQAAALGFLALLLGFSFSMSQGRFETRRQLVVQEANAIGTTFLRSRMLPAPHRAEVGKLMREYAALRTPESDPAEIEEAIDRSEAIQDELWAHAVAVSHAEPNPAVTLLFTETLNEMIDLHTMRVAAEFYRVSGGLMLMLAVASMLALGIMGYASGLTRRNNTFSMWIMVTLVSIVLMLMMDLEQTWSGMIRASGQPLRDVAAQIDQTLEAGG